MAGEWLDRWDEPAGALVFLAQRAETSNELKETLAEMRAFGGDLTGCVRTLQSGKLMLASSSPEVADDWRAKITVEGRRPSRPWQKVARALGFDPDDPCFVFSPGMSEVTGTDAPIEVKILEHVMGHLQKRIAGGADGAGFDLHSRMGASFVKPFVNFFFLPPPPLGEWGTMACNVRRLLISGRGAGLDKKDLGLPVQLRPLGIGDSLRRIAARCVALPAKGNNAAGVGMSQEAQ